MVRARSRTYRRLAHKADVRPKIKSLLTLGALVFVAGIASADTAPWRLKTEDGKVTAYGTDVGYDPTREAAMAAFAKSWRRE
jgi:hypothetical protein